MNTMLSIMHAFEVGGDLQQECKYSEKFQKACETILVSPVIAQSCTLQHSPPSPIHQIICFKPLPYPHQTAPNWGWGCSDQRQISFSRLLSQVGFNIPSFSCKGLKYKSIINTYSFPPSQHTSFMTFQVQAIWIRTSPSTPFHGILWPPGGTKCIHASNSTTHLFI